MVHLLVFRGNLRIPLEDNCIGDVVPAIIKQSQRHYKPGHVEPDIVHPVVQKLWAAVGDATDMEVGPIGAVVEQDAVEMRHADEDLEKVAAWGLEDDGERSDERKRPPCKLCR